MSDREEESFSFYGKALDPYDEDLFPRKKPIAIEEQIATDSHGRRRFHGAFTGGFSAGFFNTVGSLEGWKPSEFKSSRGDKQKYSVQNAEDFMDDEDKSEFGFAPEIVRATKDYDTTKKRKWKMLPEGPIPGEPVLNTLLTSGNETVGYLLLKNIGIQEKLKESTSILEENGRVYGCEMPKTSQISQIIEQDDYKTPDLYHAFLSTRKDDNFGLGYSGLDKTHVNSFKSSNLVIREKDKKLSIKGQAFGVGAFENDDDDIYAKEDMSNYDFEMTKEEEKCISKSNLGKQLVFGLFHKSKEKSLIEEEYPRPSISKSFTGKHKVKRSRFEPLTEVKSEDTEIKIADPIQRAELLGEARNKNITVSKPITSHTNPKNEFPSQESLGCSKTPVSKKTTFDVNKPLYDRFTSAKQDEETTNPLVPVEKYESDHFSKEMTDAAKLKMFGPLTRSSENWQPSPLLCKRFNIPDPMIESPSMQKKSRTKNLIFEYQKFHEGNLVLKPGLSTKNESNPVNKIIDKEIEDIAVKQEPMSTNESEIQPTVEATHGHYSGEKINTGENPEILPEIHEIMDEKLNTQDKGDLFKAIFFSSSESEDEVENDKSDKLDSSFDHSREAELLSNILGEELSVPKIKSAKKGVLSGLNFTSLSKIEKLKTPTENIFFHHKEHEKVEVQNVHPEHYVYGPKLPENNTDEKIGKHIPIKIDTVCDNDSDEWVEKEYAIENTREKRKKLKKKHRKDKKHKHRRK